MNLGTIMKLARGGLGGVDVEQIEELARGMGWTLQIQDLMDDQRALGFQTVAGAAVQAGAEVTKVSGRDAHGNRVEVLFVMVRSEKLKKSA